MGRQRATRNMLLIVEAFVAVTALAGGIFLVLGSLFPGWAPAFTPPSTFLESSPFSSYLVPGLVLAVVLGGLHGIAFVVLLRGRSSAFLLAAVAGYAALIWIFVQMIFIPFSVLQAVYFAAGAVELGLVLLGLGLLSAPRGSDRRPSVGTSRDAGRTGSAI